MSFSPIGDTIALTKLAYSVYNDVIKVAREAPEKFGELSRDLQTIKSVLYHIQNQVSREVDSAYGTAVGHVLQRCFATLQELRDLTAKYQKLAWSDRGVWLKRFQFANDQGAIKAFRDKFREQQALLQLILTSDGRERLIEQAQVEGALADEYQPVNGRVSALDEECACGIRRITKKTTADSSRTLSNKNNVLASSPKFGKAGCTCSYKRTFSNTTGPTSVEVSENLTLVQRSQSFATAVTHCSGYGESLDKVLSSGIDSETLSECHESEISPLSSPTRTNEPLTLPAEREKHGVGPELQVAFLGYYEPLYNKFSTEAWLRLATWWLVKSRTIFNFLIGDDSRRPSTNVLPHQHGWENAISAEQAYTDLLKSSWILEDIVLANEADENLSYNNLRRIIKEMVRSLDRDLGRRRGSTPDLPGFEDRVVLKQDLKLLESFQQTIEGTENVPNAMDDPASAHRWMEVDQDNAGFDHERVKFRTFVNAQLGSRRDRSKSFSAPYMLLLWTSADESDLLISLCNHRGTVHLSRKMTAEDLENYEKADDTMPLSLDFPSQDAEIMFLCLNDMSAFFALPIKFFTAMKDRDSLPGELAIYQAPISAYADSSIRLSPGRRPVPSMIASKYSSCGLRIYESMPDKCWKTTRRLVINSPPDSTEPRCISHWLPWSDIRVAVEGAKATVNWSDCGQLEKTPDGKYGHHYSYIYRPEEPNHKITLEFKNESEARKFRSCLLHPTEMPPYVITKLDIPSSFQNIRIYSLFDVDNPDKQYHALASTKRPPKGPHITEMYHDYRDLDWIFKTKQNVLSIVKFPSLRTAHYVSTIPELKWEPRPIDAAPDFSEVTEGFKLAEIELGCDHDVTKFMHGLTGWTLKFFCHIPKLVLIDTAPLLRSSKETHKGVGIQLWEKASEEGKSRTQFAFRLESDTKQRWHQWITASFPGIDYTSAQSTIEVRGLSIQRGDEMDSKNMCATMGGSEEQSGDGRERKKWKIVLGFESSEHKEEFRRASGLD